MTPPSLFIYPAVRHARRHALGGYERHESYKPWLRDEFTFRCVYCLDREQWYPDRAASFSVDHLIPVSAEPSLALTYANLVYSCHRCNSAKQDRRTLDPCADAYGDHFRLVEDGLLIGLTAAGAEQIGFLHLNKPDAVSERRKHLLLVAIFQQHSEDANIAAVFAAEFGYPRDMPDLRTLRPPGGNANPGGEDACYFARAERGELPATY